MDIKYDPYATAKDTLADMLNIKEYIGQDGETITAYRGMIVYVTKDFASNNGAYILQDEENISDIKSWKKVVSSDIPLGNVKRLQELLRNALNVLRANNYIFEIINEVGITKEEFDELYSMTE